MIAKFIAGTHGKLSSELRLRRPTTLSECVRIVVVVVVVVVFIQKMKITTDIRECSAKVKVNNLKREKSNLRRNDRVRN